MSEIAAKEKQRLDSLLVERGLFASREQARAAVLGGLVRVNGQKVDKPGTRIASGAQVDVLGPAWPYASRGGVKLARALDIFGVTLLGKVVLDVGAATGGFTDCALQRGAARVYAVDVGYGQLAWRLRQDPRVRVLERTNIRYLDPATLGERADLATIDVSFISLLKVLPAVKELLKPDGEVIALVKPQFEAGREKVGKKGVVRHPATHREVLQQVITGAAALGFACRGLTYSPLKGPRGNIEFLAHFSLVGSGEGCPPALVEAVVAEAHRTLGDGRGEAACADHRPGAQPDQG